MPSALPVLAALDATALRRWCEASLTALRLAREEIDALNVYPVPDGDTGTNLVLTLESVVQALRDAPEPADDLRGTTLAITRGALLGARGNSGVILSQVLRGICEPLADGGTAQALQHGLVRATQLAYAAVERPVEGTVLTVVREAAASAAELDSADLTAVVRAARSGAEAALAGTREQLQALRDAGVVDAGGRGLCVVLEALEEVVTGVAVSRPLTDAPLVDRDDEARRGRAAARESGSDEFAYEVQFLLHDSDPSRVASLRSALSDLGDSLVVVGGPELWNVHVHVNDVGAAVERGVEAGRPARITVTRFADQVAERAADQVAERVADQLSDRLADRDRLRSVPTGAAGAGAVASSTPAARAVVAVASGDGLARLFRDAGATVVDGGPGASPSTGELLDAVLASSATEVVLLPNDGNVAGVASAAASAAREQGRVVAVVPTRSVPQGLAALAVCDPERSLADDVGAMAAAAGATRSGEVTTAVREAATMAGICQPGDVLGLVDGDVVVLGADVEAVACDLLDRMLAGGGELVTVVTGAEAQAGAGDRLASYLSSSHPEVELVVYDGGQPLYPLLLGVE